ncbi:MAG: N-acetylmuramoyl-L-alanine amidase [Clostridiaceae bacterium]|nr:N-acetylmuramoyl-L-alanine amidase [Clostridiaceae bacterium]
MQIKTANRENFTAKQRKLSDIAYLVLHYTGNRGDTAKNNADYFAREVTGTSAHYFVDENEVWQSVPDGHAAWHCGTKGAYYHPACRNANSIGVEVCMLDKHGKLRQGSVDRAAALVRELMQRYGIPADRVVRHYDVTHKDCPAPMVQNPALWREFQAKLTQEDDEMKYYEKLTDIPAGELRDTVQLLIDRKAIAGNGSGLHLTARLLIK